MALRFSVLTGMIVMLSAPVSAEIYRQVDAQGNVTYTDEPTAEAPAETVKIRPVTTVTLPKPEAVREPEELREKVEKEGSIYSEVRFTSPENEQAFHSGSGDVAFEVTSSPGLRNGHKYEVTLDGQPVGQSNSGTIMVRNVYRGTHEARVNIVDTSGVTVKTGESIQFTIHRPSVLN